MNKIFQVQSLILIPLFSISCLFSKGMIDGIFENSVPKSAYFLLGTASGAIPFGAQLTNILIGDLTNSHYTGSSTVRRKTIATGQFMTTAAWAPGYIKLSKYLTEGGDPNLGMTVGVIGIIDITTRFISMAYMLNGKKSKD